MTSCIAGETIFVNAIASFSTGAPFRYDASFWVSQNGIDPGTNVTAGASNDASKCSLGVFPTSPLPFQNLDNDVCGDFPGNTSGTLQLTNAKLVCQPVSNINNQLKVPFMVAWDNQNSGDTCTTANVTAGTSSKCVSSTAGFLTGVVVQAYLDLTKQTEPDSDGTTFNFTTSTTTGAAVWTNPATGSTVPATLVDGQTKRIRVPLPSTAGANNTLTVTETLQALWDSGVDISCAPVAGSGNPITFNKQTRTITAAFNATNFGASCTITNTKRSQITLVKNVVGRQKATDQFTVSATTTGDFQSLGGTALSSPVSATTTGILNSASVAFTTRQRVSATAATSAATPASVTITDAAAVTSPATVLSQYDTTLTCTNAYTGIGATPNASLPNNSAVTTYTFTPAPADNITCTFTNTAKPTTIAIAKVSNGGTGTFSFTGTNGLTFPNITTVTPGVAVTGAVQTYATPGVTVALFENPPSGGFVVTAINCTGLGAGGNQNVNVANRTVSLDAAAVAVGSTIVCTFTNALPSSDFSITKTNGVSSLISGTSTIYTIRATNSGPAGATGAILSDPAVTGLNKTAVACSAAVGNKCVTAPSVAQLEGGTFALPALAAGEFYEITVTATVTATGY